MTVDLRWPEPRCDPIGTMSFSEWSRLSACMLRAAFARDPNAKNWNRGSVYSALGTVRHKLVEEVAAGRRAGFGVPSTDWVKARFDSLLEQQRERLSFEWAPADVPSTRQWPDVVQVRVRLARALGSPDGSPWPQAGSAEPSPSTTRPHGDAALPAGTHTLLPPAGGSAAEVPLSDGWRALVGRVDRIENRGGHVFVVDLKSGIGSDSASLAKQHRDQMLFYAGLFESMYGTWPALELVPVADPPIPVRFRPPEVDAIRAQAQSGRDEFNAAVAAGTLVPSAQPSPTRCAWCPFQVVCPALASDWSDVTGDGSTASSRAISLAAGEVTGVRRSASAVDVVLDQLTTYTAPAGAVNVTRLPSGLKIAVGDALVVSGLAPAGGPTVLRAQWDSRARIIRRGSIT